AVGDERGAAVGVDGLGRLLGAADDLRDTTGVIEEDDGAGAGDRPVDHADVAASVEQVLVGQHTDLVGGYHHLFAVLVDARDGRLATLAGQHAEVGLLLEDQRLRGSGLVAVDQFHVAAGGRTVRVDVERDRVGTDEYRLLALLFGRHLDLDALGENPQARGFVVLELWTGRVEPTALDLDAAFEAGP